MLVDRLDKVTVGDQAPIRVDRDRQLRQGAGRWTEIGSEMQCVELHLGAQDSVALLLVQRATQMKRTLVNEEFAEVENSRNHAAQVTVLIG